MPRPPKPPSGEGGTAVRMGHTPGSGDVEDEFGFTKYLPLVPVSRGQSHRCEPQGWGRKAKEQALQAHIDMLIVLQKTLKKRNKRYEFLAGIW